MYDARTAHGHGMNVRRFRMLGIIAILLLAVLAVLAVPAALYVWKGATAEVLDRAAREQLKRIGHAHEFATLSLGEVHYRVCGPETGQPVLLIHGLAIPMQVWDAVAATLADAGFRVITFDGYGRGLSSRPAVVYDEALFDSLNLELLDYLGVTEPVHIVGYSAGGVAATVFAARHPERLRSLALIAPAGLLRSAPLPTWLLRIPGMQDWLGRIVAPARFSGVVDESTAGLANGKALSASVHEQFRYAGSGEAIVSMLRRYPLSGAENYYAQAGAHDAPALILWGERDTTVPFERAQDVKRYLPRAELISLADAEHDLVYVRPDWVAAELLGFYRPAAPRRMQSDEPAVCT